MMGPALVEMAREVHAEVLALPEVSEEDVVAMVWHDRSHPSEHKEELENLQEAKEDAPSVDASGEEAPGVREAMVAAISSTMAIQTGMSIQSPPGTRALAPPTRPCSVRSAATCGGRPPTTSTR